MLCLSCFSCCIRGGDLKQSPHRAVWIPESFVNGVPRAAFCLEGMKKQGWGFTSNVFQLKSPATRGSSQLCFLPQAFDIVGAFQCVAGLLTRESQHCPALPHWIERNLPASHWTRNKLLLPQASQLFCCLFNSQVMTISVWNGLCCSLRLWVTLC